MIIMNSTNKKDGKEEIMREEESSNTITLQLKILTSLVNFIKELHK